MEAKNQILFEAKAYLNLISIKFNVNINGNIFANENNIYYKKYIYLNNNNINTN